MHMADALISPTVGATLWTATAIAIAGCANALKSDLEDRKVPLMGMLAAFVFAVQMINFTIPGTGSSGHLGGGLLLAVLLGPAAALIAMASVLTVQALFFADGGLLALGCNIFNLGVLPCLVAYPLIYRKFAGRNPSGRRVMFCSLLTAVAGLQLGAFGVVLETAASGVSNLPLGTFALLMQSIHLAIGLVEGMVTAAVVTFVWQARPEILGAPAGSTGTASWKGVLTVLAVATVLAAGIFSWFASTQPDGLEWAVARTTGSEEIAQPTGRVYAALSALQERSSLFPDYGFRAREAAPEAVLVDPGTSLAGLLGGGLTLTFAALTGVVLKKRRQT